MNRMICCENIWVLYMNNNSEVESDDGLDKAIRQLHDEQIMAKLDREYISDVIGDEYWPP